jgi:hypothetical protein
MRTRRVEACTRTTQTDPDNAAGGAGRGRGGGQFAGAVYAFKRLLLLKQRTPRETLSLVAWICVPLMLGVLVRVRVPNFLAADLSFEATAILLGLLLGPAAAMVGGAALALPAVGHHEFLALPVNLMVAAIFGAFGRFAGEETSGRFRR